MPSVFPVAIDYQIPITTDNRSPVSGELVNNLRSCILAIEASLGLKPGSTYGTVRAYLDALATALAILTDRVSTLENAGHVFTAGGDLSGSDVSQVVIGLRGRAITSAVPISGDTLVFNGTSWAPGTITGFTAGGDLTGTSTSQNVVKIQNRPVVATAPGIGDTYVWSGTQWAPGTINSFTAGGDLSGNNVSQSVISIHGATVPIAGSLTIGNSLRVSGVSALSYSALNLAGGVNFVTGTLPLANITPSLVDGYVLSTVSGVPAWIRIPIFPYEIEFVTGLASTNLTAYDRKGARKINMALYPATIGALTRTVTFVADIQKTTGASSVDVQLFDVTHSAQVSFLTYATDQTLVGVTSGALTVGSAAGNVRNDVSTMYEVSMKMSGGVIGVDTVYCNNARVVITYA